MPTETFEGECRVALSPEGAKRLAKDGFNIDIQRGAGVSAGFLDNAYESDIVFKVRPPTE